MPNAILLSRDLIFRSKVMEAAKSAGAEVQVLRDADQLKEFAQAGQGKITVLVDLQMADLDPRSVAEAFSSSKMEPLLVGYYSHVAQEIGDRAREAGFHQVLVKSQFVKVLPGLL